VREESMAAKEFPVEMEHPDVKETIFANTPAQLEIYKESGWKEKKEASK
jgi:hypothetical protein